MKTVSLQPTHIIFTTSEYISAWTGVLVARIKDIPNNIMDMDDDNPDTVVVVLEEPKEAAKLFTENNVKSHGKKFFVSTQDVVDTYGNLMGMWDFDWLPDDALIGTMQYRDLRKVYRLSQLEQGDHPIRLFKPTTRETFRELYCTCLTAEYDGTTYYHSNTDCAVHGKYNPHDIASQLLYGKINKESFDRFEVEHAVTEDYLADMTILGWTKYKDETFLLTVTPDDKHGVHYYRVSMSYLSGAVADYLRESERFIRI